MIYRLDWVRSLPWAAGVVVLLGLVVAFTGGWYLVSWHELLAPPQGVERVQYDAALAFVFGGLSLAAQALRWRLVGSVLGAVPLALGLLRLLAYALPGVIDVHPIVAGPWLPYGAGNYNDMSLLMALVLVPLGLTLIALEARAPSPARSVLTTMLAAIALALASLLIVAAWTGGMTASQWLNLTGGERVGGMLAVLLAGGLLAQVLLRSQDEQRAIRRWTPGIVWFAAFVCTLVLWRAISVQQAHYIDIGTLLVASDVKNRIERDIGVRIRQLERLAERSQIYEFTEDRWERDAATLVGETPAFQGIGWADANLVVRWVVPDTQAMRVGQSLRSDAERSRSIEEALRTRHVVVSRTVDLHASGRRGFIIYVPVFSGDTLRGMVSAGVGGNWLAAVLGDRFSDFQVALLENGELTNVIGRSENAAGSEWTQEQTVDIGTVHWTLRVAPTRDYLRRTDSVLPEASLALGTALATLLGLCTFLFQTARRRARALASSNARLLEDIQARRQVEQALRETEERTRLIIDAIKDCAIYMLDPQGRVGSWNPGAEALNGYTREEIIGRHFSVLYAPDREEPPEAELTLAARYGSFEEECWHQRKDGTRYCGDDIISAIRSEDGALQGFTVVTRDATPRIALRAQTERSRDFYFALFSGFPTLVWRADGKGACDYLNQAWLDYTGRPRDAQLGDGWLDGVHPDDRARWREAFEPAFAARQPFEIEFRLRKADGSFGSMICTGRPYHDMEGRFSGYLCSCYDNTARRAMELALKESEARYEGMTANVPGMVFELVRDADGRLSFTYVSQGGEPLTGLPESALRADAGAFFDLISSSERTHLDATLDASAAQLTNWYWSGRLLPAHESNEKWINIRARPRRLNGGVVWDGLVFDDTQARLAQLEIERSREELRSLSRHLQTVREEEKARIAREVHDELGSTLTALKMDLDWLAEHLAGAPAPVAQKRAEIGKLLETAVAATRRIVTDLRPSILDDLGISAALRWQAAEFRKHTGTRVAVETPASDHGVSRDAALALFRIFQETLTNVARHARATEVAVALSVTDAALVLQIRDNGVGLSEEDLRKPTSHGIRGMRERAQQLGGDVSVSGSAGAGTTVVISIPRAKRAPPEPAAKAPAREAMRP
ncbi:MAG TPA: PAS domain S-box protein [Casimicrobiaceae bacterium]|nr:PAS domain S-box protein [Casimicrobiaceae bacterium]